MRDFRYYHSIFAIFSCKLVYIPSFTADRYTFHKLFYAVALEALGKSVKYLSLTVKSLPLTISAVRKHIKIVTICYPREESAHPDSPLDDMWGN
jgi:hypothetical protein